MGLSAAADGAKESMTSLEGELESIKTQMAGLKKVPLLVFLLAIMTFEILYAWS